MERRGLDVCCASEGGGGEKRLNDYGVARLNEHGGAVAAAAHKLAANVCGDVQDGAGVAKSIPGGHLFRY
jgi:hypothetical protein